MSWHLIGKQPRLTIRLGCVPSLVPSLPPCNGYHPSRPILPIFSSVSHRTVYCVIIIPVCVSVSRVHGCYYYPRAQEVARNYRATGGDLIILRYVSLMGAAERVSPLIYRPFSLDPCRPLSHIVRASLFHHARGCTNTIAPSSSLSPRRPFFVTLSLSLFFIHRRETNERERRPHHPLPVHKRRVKQINKFYGGWWRWW